MILEFAISLLAVTGFALALWWARIAPVARDALQATTRGLSSMMDSELKDDAKEVAVRRAGLDLIVAGFRICWRFLVALAAAAIPIFFADGIGLASRNAVFGRMLQFDFIVIVSVGAIILVAIFQRRHSAAAERVFVDDRYSMVDRFFHEMAFSSPAVLKTASKLEDQLLMKSAEVSLAPPIFITSLARGGTTAFLNALHDIPGIATHTYRDMPFVTSPILWNWVAGGRKRKVDRHERAHGDGLEVDLDSPEAFEEVIWRMYWPEKFLEASISLWGIEDRKADAEQFLRQHMAKVVRARLAHGKNNAAGAPQYCSKNNANIARIPFLVESFTGCRIVVPVRRPECHAASLLRQHQNFLKLQSEDDFVLRYMRDIGHFEFGLIHKPIEFPGFDSTVYESTTCDYWLNYWIQAFREILQHRDDCILVLQDDLRSSPQATMESLCDELQLAPGPLQFANYFHSVPDESRADIYDHQLYQEATELYRELERTAHSASLSDASARNI
jgi:hypothetical protein